jgi:hypothetical protein
MCCHCAVYGRFVLIGPTHREGGVEAASACNTATWKVSRSSGRVCAGYSSRRGPRGGNACARHPPHRRDVASSSGQKSPPRSWSSPQGRVSGKVSDTWCSMVALSGMNHPSVARTVPACLCGVLEILNLRAPALEELLSLHCPPNGGVSPGMGGALGIAGGSGLDSSMLIPRFLNSR